MKTRSVVLTALVAAGCASASLPAILIDPGVKTAAVRLLRDEVAAFGTAAPQPGRVTRVMHLAWEPDSAELRIFTEWGARWLNPASGSHRDVAFTRHMFRASPVILSDGAVRVAGLSGMRDVSVLRLDGEVEGVLRGGNYDFPIVANVDLGPASEVLLPRGNTVRMYTPNGTLIGSVASPWYASAHTFVQADADPELEIVFVRPIRPALDVHVVNADGSVVAGWHRGDGTWLSWIPALDERLLWGVTAAGFVVLDAWGREVATYPARDVSGFRDVAGARLGEYVALVASGNRGGRSMLCVYDRDKRLVYQEVNMGLTYTMTADSAGSAIFVGAGERVMRYQLEPAAP